MHPLDLIIVIASLVGMVLLAGWLAARQRSTTDYYLGGRALPPWALGLSLSANQVSAISLIGAPAFIALKAGGGLRWLQYELAVPLAMAALIVWGVPVLRRATGASVYAAVQSRLGIGARRLLAAFFLIGRGLGTGVILYTSALVVEAVTGWRLETSLAVVGAVAVVYTSLGGLTADVISDVLQLGLLWGGVIVAMVALAIHLGGEGLLTLDGIERARLRPLVGGHGLGDGATFAFLPMLIGGFFLYLSYYGCDQTQAQRTLAAPSRAAAGRALFVAGVVRFPLVLTYCAFGVMLAILLQTDPDFAAALSGKDANTLVPQFIVRYLPIGVLGVAVAGILAAALSSIDSALNSLSAVTIEEFFPRRVAEGSKTALLLARGGTVAWGVWALVAGWWLSRDGDTVIELINKVGSFLNGPILALFILAWRSRRADGMSSIIGALVGVAANAVLWKTAPGVSWLWWNVIGCVVTMAIGHLAGRRHLVEAGPGSEPAREDAAGRHLVVILLIEFVVIVAGLALLTVVFR